MRGLRPQPSQKLFGYPKSRPHDGSVESGPKADPYDASAVENP